MTAVIYAPSNQAHLVGVLLTQDGTNEDADQSGEPAKAEKMLVERVAPVYPDAARKNDLRGEVLLLVVVGDDGKVQRTYPLSGDRILAESAEAAVKKWRYKPHLVDGLSVEFETEIRLKLGPERETPKS